MSGTPAALRRINARLLLEQLRRDGAVSRAELAKATGLSAPTVGKVAEELIDSGLIEECEQSRAVEETAMGRPGRPLRLNRTTPRILAVQLGVRHTRLAALPAAGPADEAWPVRFATPRTFDVWRARLVEAARRLSPVRRPWAVAVSVPGAVDEAAGRVLLSPNLHWTEAADLGGALHKVWSAPVVFVQEIRALALGHCSVEPADRDFLLVDFGVGLGGAAVIGGRLFEGALPLSGELGHTPMLGNERTCGCGGVGCVETLVSRGGLLSTFAATHRIRRPTWAMLRRHVTMHGVERWLASALDAAAVTIAGAINVLGLQHVVVTGVPAELDGRVIEHLAHGVQRSAMWGRFGRITCELAPRRRAAGLVTAAIDRVLMPQDVLRGPSSSPSSSSSSVLTASMRGLP